MPVVEGNNVTVTTQFGTELRQEGNKGSESADKPGSVEGNHSSGIVVTNDLKRPTRKPAGRRCALCSALLPYLVLLRVGFTVPRCVATRAVRSYRTFSPLPGLRI